MNSQAIFSKTYKIDSHLINRQGRLGLYPLLTLFQDMSVEHAFTIGHGRDQTLARNGFWVLTRQRVAMTKWPKWRDEIQLRTWVRPAKGPFAIRDFEVVKNGEVLGEATISYLMLNAQTRKPMSEGANSLDFVARTDARSSIETDKIPARTDVQTLATFEVRNSDLDVNNHVNNTRYAHWILDAVPADKYVTDIVKDYGVNFLAETKLGDTIAIEAASLEDGTHYFHGRRVSDKKIVFTALLRLL